MNNEKEWDEECPLCGRWGCHGGAFCSKRQHELEEDTLDAQDIAKKGLGSHPIVSGIKKATDELKELLDTEEQKSQDTFDIFKELNKHFYGTDER